MCQTFRWEEVCFTRKDLSKIIQKIYVLPQCVIGATNISVRFVGICDRCGNSVACAGLHAISVREGILLGTAAVIQLLPTVCSIQHASARLFLLLNAWKSTEKFFISGNTSEVCVGGDQFAGRSGHCLYDGIIPDKCRHIVSNIVTSASFHVLSNI